MTNRQHAATIIALIILFLDCLSHLDERFCSVEMLNKKASA